MKYTVSINNKKIDVDSDSSLRETLAQAKQEGFELSDTQLEQISGGEWGATTKPSQFGIFCDNCGGTEIELTDEHFAQGYADCPNCGTRYML